MRVSQRLDYTLRMLVALARLPRGTVVAAGDLAAALTLPRRFGEQQMTALAKAQLVLSRRGTGGGVLLARAPDEITVLDVVTAIEGEALDVPRATGTATGAFWAEIATGLNAQLGATTLGDLVRRQAALDAEAANMYFI